MSDSTVNSARRPRRRLSPSEKYELWVGVLTGQYTQREAAARAEVDRLRATVAEQAVALHLHEGKARWA